jgi:poly(A) polymerase
MREIWVMQPRFEKRVGSTPFGMVEQPRFRAAFDFMRLRADIGEVEEVLADWWQEFSMADDSLRQDLVDQVREEQQKRQRPARVARPPRLATSDADSAVPNPPDDSEASSAPSDGDAGAPRKRRRRRRSTGAKPGSNPDGGANTEG